MHWDSLVEPLFGLEVPAAHGVHGARPVGDQVPGAQIGMQSDSFAACPGKEHVPDGHCLQTFSLDAAVVELKEQAGHLRHVSADTAPVIALNDPSGQLTHVSRLPSENVPAEQVEQVVAPRT